MFSNSSQMVTYTTLLSPVGNMKTQKTMTAEVLEAQRCACWFPTRSTEGQEASYGGRPLLGKDIMSL